MMEQVITFLVSKPDPLSGSRQVVLWGMGSGEHWMFYCKDRGWIAITPPSAWYPATLGWMRH